MLVYGDRSETVDPRAYAEALAARCRIPAADAPDITRHAAIVGLLIDMGRLAQGLADAAFQAEGEDGEAYTFAPIAAHQLAGQMAISWLEVWDRPVKTPNALGFLLEDELPDAVTLREPEGYAFYAVYPELYMQAAEEAAGRGEGMTAVIGVRSIGTSLGAAASFGGSGYPPITLRPFGDPFARKVAVAPAVRARLNRQARFGVLVVDEGPGASGSSFGAVGDLLDDMAVPPDRVTWMPSHAGDLGPHASERHRVRWRTAKTAHARFEDVLLPRLPDWIEPLVGPLSGPLRDLSGGLWRDVVGDAPAWPAQERRKYLAVTREERFLLKFAGLAGVGERKLARACALHAAGFTPEPLGLAHGFLVERFVAALPLPLDGETLKSVEPLGAYLAFRASLPPPQGAATDGELVAMMRRNLAMAGLTRQADLARRLSSGERGPPCAIDGRLHAWEWRAIDGRLLKLDALDHCEAHDMIGAQDAAWDVAGAAVELELDAEASDRLRRIVAAESGQAIDPRRVEFQTLAYLAFQLGWWTLAAEGDGGGGSLGAGAPLYRPGARLETPGVTDTTPAAILTGPGAVDVRDAPLPQPGLGQVRIRLEGCGVCASNLGPWAGPEWMSFPTEPGALGHEGWGVVDTVGDGVEGLAPGDRVAALSYHAYAGHDLAEAAATVKLPPELDGRPFPGEPLACAMNIFRRAGIEAGQTVAIVGIGFLGAILTRLASQQGARVIAVSRRPFSLQVARTMGAAETIAMDDHWAVIEQVEALTGGGLCQRVIEAVGKQWPLDLAGELTAERGRLVIAGYHQDGPRQVNMQLWNWRGLDVINAHERDPAVYVRGLHEAVEAVASGRLDPDPLYTHRYPLERLGEGLDATRDRPDGFLKALVTYP